MTEEKDKEKVVLSHHEQQSLCTTRLPYRQGRKLTAVKVYTVNSESNHLLLFGVPSLKLRQELKSLFVKFGKLTQFAISKEHPAEVFTETYHAVFENIQSARKAKKMLDTKNFYGGSLHICYAPELERIEETRNKIFKRQQDVLNRLKNLQKDAQSTTKAANRDEIQQKVDVVEKKKLNMGEVNVIGVGKQIRDVVHKKNKRKMDQKQNVVIEKQFRPNKIKRDNNQQLMMNNSSSSNKNSKSNTEIEIIDCTSTEKETVSNIDESLNYNKFGNEIVRKIPEKPVNVIKFNIFGKK